MTASRGSTPRIDRRPGSRRAFLLIERNAARLPADVVRSSSAASSSRCSTCSGSGSALGGLIGSVPRPGRPAVPYGAFVAPALLASSAMNGAIYEATLNVFFKLQATTRSSTRSCRRRSGPADIAVGEIGWALIRGLALRHGVHDLRCCSSGLIVSPWAVLGRPGRRCSSGSRSGRSAWRSRRSCAAGRTSTSSSWSSCRCSCSAARSSRSRPTRRSLQVARPADAALPRGRAGARRDAGALRAGQPRRRRLSRRDGRCWAWRSSRGGSIASPA